MSEFRVPKVFSLPALLSWVAMAAAMLSLMQPDAIPHDVEELYNAAHARLIQLGHIDKWQALQYRGHCGGCTHNALIGSALFSLFGHSLAAWKGVPVLFNGLLVYAGSSVANRASGRIAAIAFAALVILSPPTFWELSLTAWGNHFESGVAATVVLLFLLRFTDAPSTARAAGLGLSIAWALWLGFSSLFIALGVGVALWRRTDRTSAVAIALGASTVGIAWGLQSATTLSSPFETIYQAGESIPSLTRIPSKLWSLFAPRQVVALFGVGNITGGWVAGWAVLLCGLFAGWKTRRNPSMRPAFAMLACFLAVYSVVRFTVWAPPAPSIPPPGSMRYAAPLYGLFFLVLSTGFGNLWKQGNRALAVGILAPSMAVGFAARTHLVEEPFPDAAIFHMAAPDFEYARDQMAYLFTFEEHQQSQQTESDAIALHDFGMGWSWARQILDEDPDAELPEPPFHGVPALEGIAAALIAQVDGSEAVGIRATHALLNRVDGFSADEQRTMVAAAAWKRPWFDSLPEHGPARLREWASRIAEMRPTAKEGLTQAFGRRWAHDRIKWREPRTVELPDLSGFEPVLTAAFWDGFAEGMGERLGPMAESTPPPPNSPTWTASLNRGQDRRWINRSR